MARKIFVNLDTENKTQAFVVSFTNDAIAVSPSFYRDDIEPYEFHFLRRNPAAAVTGLPFIYVTPSSLKVGAGTIGAEPDGGTFTLTGGEGGTTSALAYNASAATVQTAVRASLTGYGSATVTGDDGGPWTINAVTLAAKADITGTATSLTPDGSTVIIVNTNNGSATQPEKFQVTLAKALPILRTSGWSTLAAASVSVATTQAGSGTANKIQTVTWNADAYDGAVWVSVVGISGSYPQATVGPISFDASANDFLDALAAHPTLASTDFQVVKNGSGSYSVTFIGTQFVAAGSNNNVPTIATASNTLSVPVGLSGTLAVDTAGVDDLLGSATSVETTFEVEVRESSGQPQSFRVDDCIIYKDLIRNNPGQSTGGESFPDSSEVWLRLDSLNGLTGGGATSLDGVDVTLYTKGQNIFLNVADYGYAYTLADSGSLPSESSPSAILPDTASGTKYWKLLYWWDESDTNLSVFIIEKGLYFSYLATPTGSIVTGASTTVLSLGAAGTHVGSAAFYNATSGSITLSPVAGALGTVTLTLPAVTDTVCAIAATQTLSGKTLTAPKFADLGFIADANGNELIIFDTVTSAVNEVTFANAATGNSPTFTASGGDTNIGINLTTKGTGTVNTATGFVTSGGATSSAVGFGWAVNTGFYKSAGNTLGYAVGGSELFSLTSAGNAAFGAAVKAGTGTVGAPSFSFNAETTAGMNRPSSGIVQLCVNSLAQISLTASDCTFLSGIIVTPQALSGNGAVAAVNLTTHTTTIANTGTANTTTTLAAGANGQIKTICFITDGGFDAVVTVTNSIWGGAGTATFDTAGDSLTLQYLGSKWQVISNNGVVLA